MRDVSYTHSFCNRLLILQLFLPLMLFSYGCIPGPPHQFVPGGPVGEAGQPFEGPRPANSEEVRAMLAESSARPHNPSERVDLEELLRQITQTANFGQKQRLVDQYQHAALLLPVTERDQAFQRLRATVEQAKRGQ
jgi:hypothetical protein